MADLVRRALVAARESKTVEFKSEADFDAPQTWPELIKDIIAMANSGGGVIIVGLDSSGMPSRRDVGQLLALDPAAVSDKLHKYTGVHVDDFEITAQRKARRRLAAIEIGAAGIPITFTNVGSYVVNCNHKTAFSKGTVYFRHGAKSEPGTSADLRRAFDRELAVVRKSWLSGVRTISRAAPGTRVAVLAPGQRVVVSGEPDAIPVRLTSDPSAPAYQALDYDDTHPYRQKELIARVNKRLDGRAKVNAYDIQSVHRAREESRDEAFYHCPKYSSPQYSEEYVDWLVGQAAQNPGFFDEARRDSYNLTHP